MRIQRFLFLMMVLIASKIDAMCPATTPWTTPVQLTNTPNVANAIFSAATSAGYMAVWTDTLQNANYSFSSDGITWQGGVISPAAGQVVSNVFVAANETGFLVSWVDSAKDGWTSFSADNGTTWSSAQKVNPNTSALTPMNNTADVYVSGGQSGFIATMIGNDNNAYASFSTGTSAWSAVPTQITFDGLVNYTLVSRQYVSSVIVGNSCMFAWTLNAYQTAAAFIESINPLSNASSVSPIANIGYMQSIPILAQLNGYFLAIANGNISGGISLVSIATNSTNWATAYILAPSAPPPPLIDTGNAPWIAANQTGFMSSAIASGNAVWRFTANNGFDWTPQCSILAAPSSSISGSVGLSANSRGFIATWYDSSDANAYVSFYATPTPPTPPAPPIVSDPAILFVELLQQKYGPLL